MTLLQEKLKRVTEKYKCTLCGLCKSVCNNNAIDYETDDEGFKYAVIKEEKCINCGKCRQVCSKNTTKPIIKNPINPIC